MALRFLMDHHVPKAITNGLRQRNVDVVTAYEDGSHTLDDPDLLRRATVLGRMLFTQDEGLLRDAADFQARGETFAGLVYIHQEKATIGQCVNNLHLMAEATTPEEMTNRVVHLPL